MEISRAENTRPAGTTFTQVQEDIGQTPEWFTLKHTD